MPLLTQEKNGPSISFNQPLCSLNRTKCVEKDLVDCRCGFLLEGHRRGAPLAGCPKRSEGNLERSERTHQHSATTPPRRPLTGRAAHARGPAQKRPQHSRSSFRHTHTQKLGAESHSQPRVALGAAIRLHTLGINIFECWQCRRPCHGSLLIALSGQDDAGLSGQDDDMPHASGLTSIPASQAVAELDEVLPVYPPNRFTGEKQVLLKLRQNTCICIHLLRMISFSMAAHLFHPNESYPGR